MAMAKRISASPTWWKRLARLPVLPLKRPQRRRLCHRSARSSMRSAADRANVATPPMPARCANCRSSDRRDRVRRPGRPVGWLTGEPADRSLFVRLPRVLLACQTAIRPSPLTHHERSLRRPAPAARQARPPKAKPARAGRRARPSTTPPRSRCWRAWSRSAGAPACTSAAPTPTRCIICSPR